MKIRKVSTVLLSLIMAGILAACGPSDELIIKAQMTYKNMVDLNNQAVKAHSEIKDNSLDNELVALASEIPNIEEYNLYEMTNSEINVLIDNMNTIIASYSEYLTKIEEIKSNEEAVMLTPMYFTLENETNLTFTGLTLIKKGDVDTSEDVLSTVEGFKHGEVITGLTIYADADNTPWILSISDRLKGDDDTSDEVTMNYEFEINPTQLYDGVTSFVLTQDEDTGEVILQ